MDSFGGMKMSERLNCPRYRRRPRMLLEGEDAVYHVVTRTSRRRYWFKAREKEFFVKQLWRQAVFCGVDVLAYCVMSNHVHLQWLPSKAMRA